MTRWINGLFGIALACAILTMTGCTHVVKVPDYSLQNQPAVFAVDKKIDLNIALVQNDALRKAKWEMTMQGDTFIMEVGPQLTKNSNELASLLFKNVAVTDIPKSVGRIDAYLTPRVVAVERTMIILEWKLQDPNQNLIWIDTMKGESSAPGARPKEEGTNRSPLLEDLFRKSFQAMKSSPEIENYAASVNKNK